MKTLSSDDYNDLQLRINEAFKTTNTQQKEKPKSKKVFSIRLVQNGVEKKAKVKRYI